MFVTDNMCRNRQNGEGTARYPVKTCNVVASNASNYYSSSLKSHYNLPVGT